MDYGWSRAREASTRDMLPYRLCQKQSNKQSLTRYFLESFATAAKCSSIIKSTTFLHEKNKKTKKKVHNWCSRKVRPTKTETAVGGCHIAPVTVVLMNTVEPALNWRKKNWIENRMNNRNGLRKLTLVKLHTFWFIYRNLVIIQFYHTGCGSWYRKYWH